MSHVPKPQKVHVAVSILRVKGLFEKRSSNVILNIILYIGCYISYCNGHRF